jgi:F-type H+-transporting ATPase subunit delta
MKTTKQTKREARQLFRICRADGSLDAGRVRKVVERVIAEKPRGYLGLLSEFERLVRLERTERTAQVETAAPLPADLRASIQARLENAYGQGIEIQFTERPELIGGMRVRVGSDVYDGSVQSDLAALERRFSLPNGI